MEMALHKKTPRKNDDAHREKTDGRDGYRMTDFNKQPAVFGDKLGSEVPVNQPSKGCSGILCHQVQECLLWQFSPIVIREKGFQGILFVGIPAVW